MSSTATQVETERLASEESNELTEPAETQNPVVEQCPSPVEFVDLTDVLLIVSIAHKQLPACPKIAIPVLHLVERQSNGTWQFKARWKRNIVASHLMTQVQAIFEEHDLDANLFEELDDVVMGESEGSSIDVFWFSLSMHPVIPLPAEIMLNVITTSTVKHIGVNANFQGRAQRLLTTALLGVSSGSGTGSPQEDVGVSSGSTTGSLRKDGDLTKSGFSPDDLAKLSTVTDVIAGAIGKTLVDVLGAYMQTQSPSYASDPTGYPGATALTPAPALAPAFRRSMGLSPASEDAARVTSFSPHVAPPVLSSPATPFRRGRLSSHRSSPLTSSRRVSGVHAQEHAHGGGFGGAPDGGGGSAPSGGNPGGDGHGGNGGGDGGGDDGDPGWDRHARDGFRYPAGRERLLQQRGDPKILRGTTWTHYYCDPSDFDCMVDHRTGALSPWYANRPDFGETLCHPVATNVHFMDRELFLSGFLRPFDSRNQQRFAANFPAFDGGGDAITITDYYGRIVRYAMNFNVYVPPLHTLRDGVPLGVWFDALPSWVQVDTQNSFSGMLATCLKGKPAGLLNHDVLATIVKQHENGYNALYDLAVYAGHPLLQAYPKPLTEPVQTSDRSLADHLARWLNYIQLSTLHGTHLSDRYFLQQFVGSLHPLVRRAFGSFLEEGASRFCLDDRLPASFAPDRLLTKLLQRAAHDGCTKLVHQPPRASVAASQAVQALRSGLDPVVWDESTTLDIAALASATRACFFCGDANHLVPDCPRFKSIKSDPFQTRLLQRLLTPATTPPSRSPALKSRPRDADSKPMRQVDFDEQLDIAPLDDSVPLIADDVPADEQAADQRDFL